VQRAKQMEELSPSEPETSRTSTKLWFEESHDFASRKCLIPGENSIDRSRDLWYLSILQKAHAPETPPQRDLSDDLPGFASSMRGQIRSLECTTHG
jgi:hypothetical protein